MEWADEILKNNKNLLSDVSLTPEELKDQAAAFEKFRKSYWKNEAMEDNKRLLRDKMNCGKKTGIELKGLKDTISHLTDKVEEIR